ncbi:MAG: hypothetical protein IH795_02980, partial [Bacteroidetes bacterium]|nr:hypothetical protein [Bacteroidota bacterium]
MGAIAHAASPLRAKKRESMDRLRICYANSGDDGVCLFVQTAIFVTGRAFSISLLPFGGDRLKGICPACADGANPENAFLLWI